MRTRNVAITLGLVVLLAGVVVALASAFGSGTRVLSEEEAKAALLELPYSFEFRDAPEPDGSSGAFFGTATGGHGTVVEFGVSLGSGRQALVLAPGETGEEATGGETFLVTSDALDEPSPGKFVAEPRYRTAAQWDELSRVVNAIEQKLCRETTGEPCAV
jgi:hypothetical protein